MPRPLLLCLLVVACGGSPSATTPTLAPGSDAPSTTAGTESVDSSTRETGASTTDTATTTVDTATATTMTTADTASTDTGTAPACSDPDAAPGTTPDGHPLDGWRWAPQGPLFAERKGVAPYDGDLAPTLVDTGSGLHLLFNRQEGTQQSLWASTSADGEAWTEPVPVTGLGDDVAYPSLVFHDGVFHLYYGSGSVGYATSVDGVDFEPGDTVLRTPDAGAFASLSLLYPHAVVADDDTVDLWYAGFDGARYAIGRAEAAGLGEVATGGALELERDAAGWDNTSVAMPEVVEADGVRHLWYGGYDTVIANPGPWRIGMIDPVTGERRISLPLGATGEDAWSTRDPAVVPWGEGWLMVYIGMGDDAIYRVLSATSDVCP